MTVRVPLVASAPLVEAEFIARPNQLLIEARLGDKIVRAHMADRGRLLDLLVPEARLVLAPRDEIGRKTAFQVVGVYHEGDLVSLDTHLPNRLMAAALAANALPQFSRYSRVQPEFALGGHRFDFRLGEGLTTCILEVKSVGALQNGLAIFPDAPTERGRKQVEMLTAMARNGQRTAVAFVVQRRYAKAFIPNDGVDPAFARALRRAIAGGVEVYAYLCPLNLDGLRLGPPLPVFGSAEAIPADFMAEESLPRDE
jgi:sugar fermentation stimulation protein A